MDNNNMDLTTYLTDRIAALRKEADDLKQQAEKQLAALITAANELEAALNIARGNNNNDNNSNILQ